MRDNIPFPWIADLQPLYPGLHGLDKKPKLPLDESFAVFSEEDIFRAENPEGVRIRISRTSNTPKGDTAFWQKALMHHLGPLYAEAEQLEFQEGDILGVHFTSKDSSPFHYIVSQKSGEEFITVLEAFFPDDVTFAATKASVYSAFEGVIIP